MIEATGFRNAMSLLSTAVNVITTAGEAGMHGFTASAVCSVTDTPPTLLVCMNQSSRSHAQFLENKVLSVNVLSTQHEQLSNAFASKLNADNSIVLVLIGTNILIIRGIRFRNFSVYQEEVL